MLSYAVDLLSEDDFRLQQSILKDRIARKRHRRESVDRETSQLRNLIWGQLRAEIRTEQAAIQEAKRRDARQAVLPLLSSAEH